MTRLPLLALPVAAAVVVARRRSNVAPAGTPFPSPAGRPLEVMADDGVVLRGTVHGPADATSTVVLVHGYELSERLWARQVEALLAARPDLRVVTYDHRGHGGSDRSPAAHATLVQLGVDLHAVLAAAAPAGPVLLAGHSMGGMTLMAFAEQHPAYVAQRLVGAAFLSTSPGRLVEVTYGLPKAAARLVQRSLPWFNERARAREQAGRGKPARPGIARLLFGGGALAADVAATLAVMADCPAATVADFHATFVDHDRVAALEAFASVPVLVVCGSQDRICPLDHSRDVAAALPHGRLVVYPGAGHMVQLERAAEVSARLVELADALPRPDGRRRTRSSSPAS